VRPAIICWRITPWDDEQKTSKKAEPIQDVAARGCAAFEDQTELRDDSSDGGEWNKLSRICRCSLQKLSLMCSKTNEDVLAKARLLALAVQDEGEGDQRFCSGGIHPRRSGELTVGTRD
jgi:hypothetical protein